MNSVFIATSIDGYIATPDGGLSWLDEVPNVNSEDAGYSAFMARIDALVMGRSTYETVLGFEAWPYGKPVFVPTTTLTEVPEHLKGKVEFISGTPQEIVSFLNAKGHKRLYIDGGKTIQRFLAAGLIDEMIITRIPVVLGEGIPLFANEGTVQWFEHIHTEVFLGAMVQTQYLLRKK